jgi:hypothetical protein
MKIFRVSHSTPVHLAILHVSAWLVPSRERAEWLAEWRTELWYASRAANLAEVTGFCLGAFRDALWLRRNAPLPRAYGSLLIDVERIYPDPPPAGDSRFLESPVRCLALLGFLAVLCVSTALLLLSNADHAERLTFLNSLTFFACAWLIVPATTTMSLGDYPAGHNWLRRWIFFAAKIVLIFLIVIASFLAISPLGIHIGFWACVIANRWALLDQRRRCPVCLRLLANPVRMGDRSRIFLEWSGTELMCLRGHGLLHVPESPAIWFNKQRWLDFDSSWRGLFRYTRS